REGTVYLGSENGLIRVQVPANKEDPWFFYNYGAAQGFEANDYSANASTLMKNGALWLPAGSDTQINILAPEAGVDTTSQGMRITGISILDQDRSFESLAMYEPLLKEKDTLWDTDGKNYYLKGTLPQDTSYVFEHKIQWDSLPFPFTLPLGLKLPYDQNYLRFQYANLSVLNRDKIAYRYRLVGNESKWNYPGNKSESKNYFNLPSGQYTFTVETREITGIWGSSAEYTFSILPPWWQTWWAYLLYAIVAIGSIWGIVQYRSRQLKRKNRLLEEKVALRTKELRKTITSLKSTQAQLIQSEKMASLGELTAGIAHEIQNPLNFVNNFSEVNTELIDEMQEELKAGNKEEAITLSNDIRENQKKINHHGRRADAIVKGMLQHSRNSNSEREDTDINALADEYLRLAYHGLRAKDKSFNAKLETDFDTSIKKINIVAQDVGRVILNLITNAFYVVKQKKEQQKENYEPTVSVRTKKNKDTISISVKDNGNGIPKAIKEKIFQPFFTTKPSGEGTGLGLSLSYDIVKSHGGELKVETKEGEGTEFTIILPIIQTKKL
ncbi:MAG: ATP-binding protein, partial [Flavobacteriaceae bacterium]